MERENPTLHNRDIQLHETKCYLSNITSSRNKHTGKLKATLLLQTLSLASLQGLLLCINGLPRWQCSGEESACQCKRQKKHEFDPWVRKIPWHRKWQHTPVLLPRQFHGQRSLAGYNLWSHKEPDMTEYACTLYKPVCSEFVVMGVSILSHPSWPFSSLKWKINHYLLRL